MDNQAKANKDWTIGGIKKRIEAGNKICSNCCHEGKTENGRCVKCGHDRFYPFVLMPNCTDIDRAAF